MRLPDDDEIYNVDSVYLGPPGRFIGRFRQRAIILFPGILLLVFVIERRAGFPFTLLTVGLTVMACAALTASIVDHTSSERSLGVLLRTSWQEVIGRRPRRATPRKRRTRSAEKVLRKTAIRQRPEESLGPRRTRFRDLPARTTPDTDSSGS